MGIPSYFSYIIDKYSKIVKQRQDVEKIENLWLIKQTLPNCLKKLNIN